MAYFNTTSQKGVILERNKKKATSQEQRLMVIFREYDRAFTPFDLQKYYSAMYNDVPITSIRRALTILTDDGEIIKTSQQSIGKYGRVNCMWRLKK